MIKIILPSDMLRPNKTDNAFTVQAQTYYNTTGTEPILYDGEKLRKSTIINKEDTILYLGWILTETEYEHLNQLVQNTTATMLTNTEKYTHAQFIDKWYPVFKEHTPRTFLLPPETKSNNVPGMLPTDAEGPFIIKDASKSLKDYWLEACYAPTKNNLPEIIENFRRINNEEFQRHIVIREYENFTTPEMRAWWYKGKIINITPHPNTPTETFNIDRELTTQQFSKPVQELGSPFMVTDIVLDEKGNQRIVECGDAQVSSMPTEETTKEILQYIIKEENTIATLR